jgi:hypothetical protein
VKSITQEKKSERGPDGSIKYMTSERGGNKKGERKSKGLLQMRKKNINMRNKKNNEVIRTAKMKGRGKYHEDETGHAKKSFKLMIFRVWLSRENDGLTKMNEARVERIKF